MKRFIAGLNIFILVIASAEQASALSFGDMLNSLTNALNKVKTNTTKTENTTKPSLSPRSLGIATNKPNKKNNSMQIPTSANASCSYMLEHSPKNSTVESTAKKVVAGALIGAAAGAMLDSKNRAQGAIIGAIAGGAIGVGYSYFANKDRLLKGYDEASKELGYNHQVNLLKITRVVYPNQAIKIGDYLPMVIRIAALTPQKPSQDSANSGLVGISLAAYGIKDGQRYYMGQESYQVKEGIYPIYFMFPICNIVKPGPHEIEFRASGLGQSTYADVRFNVQ